MSGFTRAASRLTCGAICWLFACSLMAAWTMDYPDGVDSFALDEEVPGTGDAPAANLTFSFKICEHGTITSTPVVIASGNGTTEDVWWDSTVGPPNEGTWPEGFANAGIFSQSGLQDYRSIEFVDQ